MQYHIGKKHQREGGFTLIEIAIVVVIIGLLLGGVLKGQEMIRNARAHNVADQGNAVKAAILGFSDRYRALPGDYREAFDNIPGLLETLALSNGDGNSRIGYNDSGSPAVAAADNGGTPIDAIAATPGTPDAGNRAKELGLTWLHLSRAGFISGNYDGAIVDETDTTTIWAACVSSTCMTNAFNGSLLIAYGSEQTGTTKTSNEARSNQLLSGSSLPIEIIAELDRKVDDGKPQTGSFRLGDAYVATCGLAAAGAAATVTDGVADLVAYAIKDQVTDCGGVYQF